MKLKSDLGILSSSEKLALSSIRNKEMGIKTQKIDKGDIL
jgi:hypothetical protein